ncbi:maleylpyruvate isomerase family mycothiol-dependent enzyme [Nocardia huaxiensis]|uniref:Maleylpyruvate isomerase family mycothiol-dependent enzyme n=1 Tax=Nocardia huaxiensis TaxID=2755382 RepID=A0A7D6VB83_9NOCA|nr:maleylpyruvate isomerase family mycothiol-dependent enzyme [Nocardia huaxiensis]QLY28737.1 maleylpyruvate isomerase family mycothiol-dependent enzyme [Nocardia huaxiensis]UFS97788.1 maleylpyruvate isomerase family mycothiol-dependent enzyme [Nocardia huaxiensis]
MTGDVWALVHIERAALIEDLAQFTDDQWGHPSLCDGWTVHDVAAHLVDVAHTTRLGFMAALAKARFDFDRQNADGVKRWRGSTPQETLRRLRAAAPRTSTPPAPLDSRLVEEIVHGEDIRRPLGVRRPYPKDAVARALRLQTRTPAAFGGAKQAMSRIRLTATDFDLTLGFGGGAEVRGPVLALLLAVSGRQAALDELDGPGVAALANPVAR